MDERTKQQLAFGLNSQDDTGKTPLMLAVWSGDADTVKTAGTGR